MLHGDLRTGRSFDGVARDLSEKFHVVSLDARGHGDSDWTPRGYRFDERVEDLKAFCDMLEARGIEFFVPYRYIPIIELKIAFFTDPSGVVIELTEGFDLY